MGHFDEDGVLVESVQLLQNAEQPIGQKQALAYADPADHGLKAKRKAFGAYLNFFRKSLLR